MSVFTFHALPPTLADDARRAAIEQGRAVPVAGDGDGPYPVRCCLRDVEADEGVLLLSAQPMTAASPYAAPGPIYLHQHACAGYQPDGDVPEILQTRLLSVRAFDGAHMMTGTEVVQGAELESAAERLLAIANTAYLHVHFAGAGCFACRVEPRAA
jgi:uncharacterized protein DUF1203